MHLLFVSSGHLPSRVHLFGVDGEGDDRCVPAKLGEIQPEQGSGRFDLEQAGLHSEHLASSRELVRLPEVIELVGGLVLLSPDEPL